MRFRRRLQMNIIPILLFAVLFVTATVVYTSSVSLRALQEDIMKYRVEVIYEYTASEYNTLSRVNLDSTKRYVEEAKNSIFEFIKETELPGGLFIIIDSNNNIVFHTGSAELEMPVRTSQYLAENIEKDIQIKYQHEGRKYLTYYEYFEPWDWYVLAVADRDIIFEDVDNAVRLAFASGFAALVIAGYSLNIIARTISRPVEDLTKGTIAMKNGDYDVRVGVKGTDEIGELAIAFNSMAEEIEDNFTQIRAKSESLSLLASFAAGMSHDLKTPIGNSTTVISFMESELKKFQSLYKEDRLTKEKLESYIREIDESLNILGKNNTQASELVTGYKTVSVDQLNRERRWIDLKGYVDEVIYALRPKLKKTNYEINNLVDEGLTTWTYPGALSQILTNLVVNSLIHGFENRDEGIINIAITKEGGNIVMVYTDDGIGISEDHLKKLYDAFFTTKHDQGGSGLGMHIIYNLVKSLLHGTVECESALGQGVKFTIVFPDESYIS